MCGLLGWRRVHTFDADCRSPDDSALAPPYVVVLVGVGETARFVAASLVADEGFPAAARAALPSGEL